MAPNTIAENTLQETKTYTCKELWLLCQTVTLCSQRTLSQQPWSTQQEVIDQHNTSLTNSCRCNNLIIEWPIFHLSLYPHLPVINFAARPLKRWNLYSYYLNGGWPCDFAGWQDVAEVTVASSKPMTHWALNPFFLSVTTKVQLACCRTRHRWKSTYVGPSHPGTAPCTRERAQQRSTMPNPISTTAQLTHRHVGKNTCSLWYAIGV